MDARLGLIDQRRAALPLVGVRQLLFQLEEHRVHHLLRLLDVVAVPEPRDHVHHVVAARLDEIVAGHDLGLHHERDVDRHVEHGHRAAEVRGRDAHDLERASVQLEDAPHDAGVAPEAVLPEGVSQDGDRVGTRPAVLLAGQERPPQRRHDAVRLEEVGAREEPEDALAASALREGHLPPEPRRGALEYITAAVPHVLVVRDRVRAVLDARPLAIDLHELPGLGDAAERAQQQAVNGREGRGVQSDPERQGQDGRDGEERALHEHPQAVLQIVEDLSHGDRNGSRGAKVRRRPGGILRCRMPKLLPPALLALGVLASAHAVAQELAVVLDGANLVDGTGAAARRDARIVVSGGTIACVGSPSSCPAPTGAERIELPESAWVVPGLVDAHVHFGQTGWLDGRPSSVDLTDLYPYERVIARQKNDPDRYFRSYVCSGVTAVFDTGGFPWSMDLARQAERSPLAPHVVAAGPRITHAPPAPMNLPAEQQYLLLDSEASGRAAVRYMASFGADVIKIWFLAVPTERQDDVDAWVLAAADETSKLGLPLIVHATSLREAKVALRGGVHLLVHGVDDQPVDDEFLRMAKETGALYTPTLLVSDGYRRVFEALTGQGTPEVDDPNRCVDAATYERFLESPRLADHPSVRAFDLDLDAYRNRLQDAYVRKTANLLRVFEAGIPIVLGTDAGNPGSFHGPAIYPELEAMQAAGIEPEDLLVIATRNGARAMGREDIGTLTAGSVADLVVLSANPLEDIANLRRVTHVMRAGALRPIEALSQR